MTENGTHHGIRWQNEGNTNHGKPSTDSDFHIMCGLKKNIDDLDAEHPQKNVRVRTVTSCCSIKNHLINPLD